MKFLRNYLLIVWDAPQSEHVYSQDSAIPQVEYIPNWHPAMLYLIIILFAVAWIIIYITRYYVRNSKSNKYNNYNVSIELFWAPVALLVGSDVKNTEIVLFRMILVALLCLDIIFFYNIFVFPGDQLDIRFGYFVVTFKALIIQFLIINLSICKIIYFSMRNKYDNPTSFISKLFIKLFIRCIDFSSLGILLGTLYTGWLDLYTIKLSILSVAEQEELNENLRATLNHLIKLSFTLENIKREYKEIKLILSAAGDLQLEVDRDTKLSNEELRILAQRVTIADRAYNTQLSEYRKLVRKDIQTNEGAFSDTFRKHFNSAVSRHDRQFDVE